MELKKLGTAGTLESGDIRIELDRGENGIEVDLNSTVGNQFGNQITRVITETVKSLGIENAKIFAVDKGALDCTIKARVATAVYRACECEDYKWN